MTISRRHEDSCRSCKAPIYWARTRASMMPVDRKPLDGGNVELRLEGTDLVAVVGAAGPGRYVSHFVTCPDAAKYRKKKGG